MSTVYNEPHVFDPIRFCVFTTIALLAWIFSAPVAVMALSGLGLWAYVRAWRRGLRESRCLLRRPVLVIVYLALAFGLGAACTLLNVLAWIGK